MDHPGRYGWPRRRHRRTGCFCRHQWRTTSRHSARRAMWAVGVGVALDAPRAVMSVTSIATSRARCRKRSSQGPRSTALHWCGMAAGESPSTSAPQSRAQGAFAARNGRWIRFPLIPFRPCAGVELPVFARHEYRTWELDKRVVRSAARRWSCKLKFEPTGKPARQAESRSSGLPV